MIKLLKSQKGYVISLVSFFVMIIMLSIAMSVSFLVANSQKKITNIVKATQSYYAAESGAEDALRRLKKTPSMSPITYPLTVNNATVTVNIPSTVDVSKNITSQSNNGGIVKNIQTVCSIKNTEEASFYYGVEVGAGGLTMNNGSEVIGNVFSEGNITGSGIIDNNVVVSGNGNSISGVHVKGNVLAYSCLSGATVDGNLTYVTGGSHACTVKGTTTLQSYEILDQPLPIPQSQIDEWKSQAAAVQVINGDYNISNNKTVSLGLVKITGSLNISNNSTLNMTGIVYVQGNINLSNNSTIKLDSSYGPAGGVFISDGIINVSNGTNFSGSGQTGSYLLVISTSTSDSAISISNNAAGAVFYTSAGGLSISNGVSLVEATGYKVIMNNNSKIQYSSGIANIYFTSGPGGGWQVTSWQEQ